jgi:uncharacterized protein (DUF433 family)
VIHSDPEILSGTPVFVGTRVPVQSLFDYLEGGDTLDEFLRQFPSVRREQAIAALELARDQGRTMNLTLHIPDSVARSLRIPESEAEERLLKIRPASNAPLIRLLTVDFTHAKQRLSRLLWR